MFQIEDGVPIPPIVRRGKGPGRPINRVDTIELLGVWQSFFEPTDNRPRTVVRMCTSAQKVRRRYPERKFVVRAVEGGVRMWRTA